MAEATDKTAQEEQEERQEEGQEEGQEEEGQEKQEEGQEEEGQEKPEEGQEEEGQEKQEEGQEEEGQEKQEEGQEGGEKRDEEGIQGEGEKGDEPEKQHTDQEQIQQEDDTQGIETQEDSMQEGEKQEEKQNEDRGGQPELEAMPSRSIFGEEEAATKIQALGRGRKVRKEKKKEQDAVVKIQALGRGTNVRKEKRKKEQAAVKIQALARGKRTRSIIKTYGPEAARAAFMDRQTRMEGGMKPSDLVEKSSKDKLKRLADEKIVEQAKTYSQAASKEEMVAATKMQSLYRGFRDRKVMHLKREQVEERERLKAEGEKLEITQEAEKKLNKQAIFERGGSITSSYLSPAKPIRAEGRQDRSTQPRGSMLALQGERKQHTPTLVDKKATMSDKQKKACFMLEDLIRRWATSYARSVELADGALGSDKLEFVALFSKPSKEEPIAWPVVRVYFTVPEDFENALVPNVRYNLENERMVFHYNTDLGRRFKESWLDRIVMDKRAIRADMALRNKR